MTDHIGSQTAPLVIRAEAKALGMKKYSAPSECSHGPITVRYVATGACVRCQRTAHDVWKVANPGKAKAATDAWKEANPGAALASTMRWRAANPDLVKKYETRRDPVKKREAAKVRHAKNPEKARAKNRKWFGENPDKRRAYEAAWAIKFPEKRKAKTTARRSREAKAEGSHTGDEILALFARQCGQCAYCGTTIVMVANRSDSATEDHIVALVNGGSNWISNIALACKACNSRKGTTDAANFIREMAARKAAA